MIRHATTSPVDGSFSALVTVEKLPDGLHRVTKDPPWGIGFRGPASGSSTTWASDAGAIYKVQLGGRGGSPTRALPLAVVLAGCNVVFQRGTGNVILGVSYGTEPGLYWISSDAGDATFIRESGELPRFSRNGERVYFVDEAPEQKQAYKSVRLDGGDERVIFTSKRDAVVPSPNEEWLAFRVVRAYVVRSEDRKSRLTGKPGGAGQAVTRDADSCTGRAAAKLHWTIRPGISANSRWLRFVEGAADSIAPPTQQPTSAALPGDVPTGGRVQNTRIIHEGRRGDQRHPGGRGNASARWGRRRRSRFHAVHTSSTARGRPSCRV
jgi:hypothetical protein